MAGRNYGTMNQGYHYDEGKQIGYHVTAGNLFFQTVAYHSKGQLIDQLVNDGYKREYIKVQRIKWL